MFKFHTHLGFNNPYYYEQQQKFIIKESFSETAKSYNKQLTFDVTAAIEIINKNHSFADRTLAKEINKTPWQAKPSLELDEWIYNPIPEHAKLEISENEIAEILFQRICEEIKVYIGNHTQIGVLLSGGMDSRMLAGALDFLIKEKKIHQIRVTGITWGNDNSRDVIYAKEIARRLGWEWKHYKVTAKDFLQNIEETAIHGCEYSPLHLHAIPQIRNDNYWEVILGGSYGDSIGRAEYGGVKVKNIKPLSKDFKNIASLIYDRFYIAHFSEVKKDLTSYHSLFPRSEHYQQNELDYQIHYMRRMLNPCMELLTENAEFHQVFTHPSIFGFMWSLAPEKRNDLVYKEVMRHFSTPLEDIPWARTGLRYMESKGKPDNFSNRHHNYIEIIQKEIWFEIKELVLSKHLFQLGVFNPEAIKVLVNLVETKPYNSMFYIEQLAWLASVSRMLEIYPFTLAGEMPLSSKSDDLRKRIAKEYLPRYYRNRIGFYLRKFNLLK